MLASLLPGLRDIRTPLTVGYLYLLAAWIWFANDVPRKRPEGNALVARLFDLSHIFGTAASLAALTFIAYVLGALLSIAIERCRAQRLLALASKWASIDAKQTSFLLDATVRTTVSEIEERAAGFSPAEMRDLDRDLSLASRSSPADLRVRMLVANQELYSEYDRLAAEGEFRLNLCLPLAALGMTTAAEVSLWYVTATAAVVLLLAYQGNVRRAEAESVIYRAVLSGIIEHPVQTILKRFGKRSEDYI